MTIIRVNPASVRAYGAQAQTLFEGMQQSLVSMVDDMVAVRYFGPNAVAFKTECGAIAADFGNALHTDMSAIAMAVQQSTSNIAASLGGAPITIQVDNRPIVPPTPVSVDYVDVDTAALEAIVPVVGRRFAALREALRSNLGQLRSTDWEGMAKLAAVDTVASFTTNAQTRCDGAELELSTYINRQIENVVLADR